MIDPSTASASDCLCVCISSTRVDKNLKTAQPSRPHRESKAGKPYVQLRTFSHKTLNAMPHSLPQLTLNPTPTPAVPVLQQPSGKLSGTQHQSTNKLNWHSLTALTWY